MSACSRLPSAKKIGKEIMFLISFATDEIFSASLVVENVKILSDLSLSDGGKNKEFNFSVGEIREWKTRALKFEP